MTFEESVIQDAIKVLKDSRELLSDKEKWTKHEFARTDAGEPLNVKIGKDLEYIDGETEGRVKPSAYCFCTVGAVMYSSQSMLVFNMARSYVRLAVVNGGKEIEKPKVDPHVWVMPDSDMAEVFNFNDDDNTTHADVLAVFDRAITLAEEDLQINKEMENGSN